MLTFSASSSVEVVAKCRVVKQASKQASSEWNGSQGYISGVLFVDGGFCVGNELSPAFKQVPALNIWQRAGFRAWEWTRAWMHAEQLRPSQAHLTLGTAGGVLRQTTHHSCKTLVRHGSHPARHATSFTHSLVPYPTSAVSLSIVASARLHHLNLGCAAPMAYIYLSLCIHSMAGCQCRCIELSEP